MLQDLCTHKVLLFWGRTGAVWELQSVIRSQDFYGGLGGVVVGGVFSAAATAQHNHLQLPMCLNFFIMLFVCRNGFPLCSDMFVF